MWILFGWHTWWGESGRPYRFKITLTPKGLPDQGGVYVFVQRRFVFFLFPLYIGKAANFKNRLIGHERWWEAWWKRGATERHVLVIKKESDRARIEEDLIRRYQPRRCVVCMGRLLRRVEVAKRFLSSPPFPGGLADGRPVL